MAARATVFTSFLSSLLLLVIITTLTTATVIKNTGRFSKGGQLTSNDISAGPAYWAKYCTVQLVVIEL